MEEETSYSLLKNARLGLYRDKPSLETPSNQMSVAKVRLILFSTKNIRLKKHILVFKMRFLHTVFR
jgi:hypothetical protein